jgi:hypothetical protein
MEKHKKYGGDARLLQACVSFDIVGREQKSW